MVISLIFKKNQEIIFISSDAIVFNQISITGFSAYGVLITGNMHFTNNRQKSGNYL